MKFQIYTDAIPSETGTHNPQNWESPTMNKYNKAIEFLQSYNSKGHYECFFDSKQQIFSATINNCIELTEYEISNITTQLNNI